MLDKIKDLGKLKKGWNGYSADPPTLLSFETALKVLKLGPIEKNPPKKVVPSVVGGIGLIWDDVYVEVLNNGDLQAVFGSNRPKVEDMIIEFYGKDLSKFENMWLLWTIFRTI